MSKNLIQRLVVAAIFIPAILWISYEGGRWLYGMVMIFAAVAMSEYLVAEGYSFKRPAFWFLLLATIILVDMPSGHLLSFIISLFGKSLLSFTLYPYKLLKGSDLILLVIVFLILGMVFSVGKRSAEQLFAKMTRMTWGVMYIGLLYPFVYRLHVIGWERRWPPFAVGSQVRGIPPQIDQLPVDGGDALLFLFALLWIGDTAAMWVGSTMGKHKLAPSVSPNKTVEGFIGGLVAAALVGLGMAYWKFTEFPLYQILIVAVLCSLFGQLGDLVESMWKRSLGIKDSSAIIPGHGGFLDRFDSLLFAAPVMYYFFVIFR